MELDTREDSVLRFMQRWGLFKGRIHLWGLASVIPGMLEPAVVVPQRASAYRSVARNVLTWILDHAWNGEQFEAIFEKDGSHVESRPYMVRSDAWVFNALASAAKDPGRTENSSKSC